MNLRKYKELINPNNLNKSGLQILISTYSLIVPG